MPIQPLDKTTADAICTIVAIGFMKAQSQIEDEYRRTKFQYELTGIPDRDAATLNEHNELALLITP